MKELEYESRVLGIPVKTRHNEVAPAQYEFAPVFEEANVAVDHNSLFMDLIEKWRAGIIFGYFFMKSHLRILMGLVNTTMVSSNKYG